MKISKQESIFFMSSVFNPQVTGNKYIYIYMYVDRVDNKVTALLSG